jgi:soluble lytic murein transglycosylase-like protein
MEIGADGARWIGAPATVAHPAPDLAPEVADMALDTPVQGVPDRWRDQVYSAAIKYNLSPNLLEAVVWQESRWRPDAVSPAGARGLTQLMPGTARQMGVNPLDPLANLEGGARYLRMQLDLFDGDVERALAAYNAGPGRVQRAGGIPAIRETQIYVASIMARLSRKTGT